LIRPCRDDDFVAEAVAQLEGMGFSRAAATDALARHGNNVQQAANSLLR